MANRLPTEALDNLELLHRVGVALSAERNKDRLIEMILLEAKGLCRADGGTLYLRSDDELRFAIVHTDSLDIQLGGTTGKPIEFAPIPLFDPKTGEANHQNVASHAVHAKESVNIRDAYDAEGYDFTGTKAFDAKNGYRSTSFLTIPMINNEGHVIGVLQLLNARDGEGNVAPFYVSDQRIVEALASQAAIALDNQILIEGQRELLESFIKLIASSIDAKSPYTGAHCERVPIITEMLAREACATTTGPAADFDLDEEGWYELRIAAWLHDCGKITTPVHVMDKATKLETIYDRFEVVRTRFELLKKEAEISFLKAVAAGGDATTLEAEYHKTCATLDEDLELLAKSNIGGEFLPDEQQQRIREIAQRRYSEHGEEKPLLGEFEIENLCISRGTLTESERLIINGHMVHTIKMLEALPFTRNLRRVPEYAGGHHEKMDGKGYPKGLFAGDMSVPARIMAIADVFEALTSSDRPYKAAKKLSTTMRIMGEMKRYNHLDPDLFDLFVRSGIYREFADRFLAPELNDDVDAEALLAIEPKPFELPPEDERKKRWADFLAEYRS